MRFDLTGRTALVTGAGQNVGAGIAAMLAAQGAVVAVNDVVAERADAGAQAINEAGAIVRAVAAPFDVTDCAQVLAGVHAIEEALGPVDILVNNVEDPIGGPLESFRATGAELDSLLNRLVRAAWPA